VFLSVVLLDKFDFAFSEKVRPICRPIG
jgi:hypothetical protein